MTFHSLASKLIVPIRLTAEISRDGGGKPHGYLKHHSKTSLALMSMQRTSSPPSNDNCEVLGRKRVFVECYAGIFMRLGFACLEIAAVVARYKYGGERTILSRST